MSDPAPPNLPPTDPSDATATGQPVAAAESTAPDADDTVGTGSAIAIGCIAATLLLIVLGLLLIAAIAILG